MTKLETDEKTFRCEHSGEGEHNHLMEVKATSAGLWINESVIVPWDWILAAMTEVLRRDPHLSMSIYED